MTFHASYVLPVLLALVVLFVFPLTRHMERASDRRRYWTVQACVMLGALTGAKLMALAGDYGWPLREVPGGIHGALNGGRSIVGGLLGGWLAGAMARPLVGYKLPPNDRFAAVLPISIATGRVGCYLTGCCAGTPHTGILSSVDAHGVSRWPVQLMEVAFQLSIAAVFAVCIRRGLLRARLFAVYLIAYGAYRFGSEFVRDTPKLLGGLSVYQLFSLVMAMLGVALATRSSPPRAAEVSA